MNSIDRAKKFDEAFDALTFTIRKMVQTKDMDPLAWIWTLVHRTSPETYRALLAHGGEEIPYGGGFVISVGVRQSGSPLDALPLDTIACMISIDNQHKAIGIPLDILTDDAPRTDVH